MTVIEDRPRTRDEGDTAPVTAEVLFAEARARGRRRRNRLIGIIAGVLAAAVAISAWLLWVGRQPNQATLAGPAIATTANGFPRDFVAWDGPSGHNPGGIELISSTTGKTVRVLVKNTHQSVGDEAVDNPLAYLTVGFDLTNDGRTVYYNSNYRIDSVTTTDGVVSHVVTGSNPLVSPDARLLAYRPRPGGGVPILSQFGAGPTFAIKDLGSGAVSKFTIPRVQRGQAVTASWLPDSRHILIYAPNRPACSPGPSCGAWPNGGPSLSTVATVLDVTTGEFTGLSSGVSRLLDQSSKTSTELEGAGSSGSNVRISMDVDTSVSTLAPSDFVKFGMLNIRTGRVRWQYALPAGYWSDGMVLLPGQDSGTHFVVTRTGAQGAGLYQWSPAERPSLRPIGTTPRSLAYFPYWNYG
jgi:hypothetical protein